MPANPKYVPCPVCRGEGVVGIEFDCYRCGGFGSIQEGSELAVNWPGLIFVVLFFSTIIWMLNAC